MKSNILFNFDDHKYYNNNIEYLSVTSLVGKYKNQYNAIYWSLYKAYQRVLGEEKFKEVRGPFIKNDWTIFDRLAEVADPLDIIDVQKEILLEYKASREEGIDKGNKYHNFKEKATIDSGYGFNSFDKKNYTTRNVNKEFRKNKKTYKVPLYKNLHDLEDGFYPELIIWNDEHQLMGQADKVYIETIDSTRYVDIDDYKTYKKLDKSNYFQKMKPPLSHLDDCNYIHTILQVGLYAFMMQLDGFTPRALGLSHLNELHILPYYRKEVELMLGIHDEIPFDF